MHEKLYMVYISLRITQDIVQPKSSVSSPAAPNPNVFLVIGMNIFSQIFAFSEKGQVPTKQ